MPGPNRRGRGAQVALLLAVAFMAGASCARSPVEQLITRFTSEPVFWKQLDIAEQITQVATRKDISELEPWMAHPDRRCRGNAAYIFAKLGDRRGIEAIVEILNDYSVERTVHDDEMMLSWISSGDPTEEKKRREEYRRSPEVMRAQTTNDRYHAVHLLGMLRDRSTVDILIPMLEHDELSYNVAWALGEIGDSRAIPPLIGALASQDAVVRVSAIGALEQLHAAEAIPRLESLFNDTEIPRAGNQTSVGSAARRAAASIQRAHDDRN